MYEGWVYTIDPVTHTWVLLNELGGTDPELHLVMNVAVTSKLVVDSHCPQSVLTLMETYGLTEKVFNFLANSAFSACQSQFLTSLLHTMWRST